MSVRIIGTTPVQIAPRNPRRHALSVQLLPTSVASGNTGKVYGKFGSAPIASITSNSWDFVLNAGAVDGANLYESTQEAFIKEELWVTADAANQQVNVVETLLPETPPAASSGAAAA